MSRLTRHSTILPFFCCPFGCAGKNKRPDKPLSYLAYAGKSPGLADFISDWDRSHFAVCARHEHDFHQAVWPGDC